MDIAAVLNFCRLLMQFQAIERFGADAPAGFRENDAEHSYSLAMMAWHIAASSGLNLDQDLIRRYALVHDLVEVYAGDTHAFDPKSQTTKQIRETLALSLLQQEYTHFPELPGLIHNYEAKIDPEARFVYALDKIMPPMMIYLNQNERYIDQTISVNDVIAYVEPKIAIDPTINSLWREFKPYLATRPELFTK